MSTVSVNAIVDASGGNTATINGIPLRQGVLDPQNLIINGAFDFWQRGTSFTGQSYTADRWFASNSGGTVTTSRQAFTLGDTLGSTSPTYFFRQTVSGQTGSNYAYATHRIEGVRSYAGQTITVLGWAKRFSGSGNMTIGGSQIFGTGGSPSSSVGITEQTVTLTASFAPFAIVLAVPSIVGKTLGSNSNDYLEILFGFSNGGSFGLQTIAVDLWGVHIKLGTQTTAAVDLYKQPELGPELVRCQRYYYRATSGLSIGGRAFNYSTTTRGVGIGIAYPVEMRSVPAVIIGWQINDVSQAGQPSIVSSTTSEVDILNDIATLQYIDWTTINADAEL